MVLRTSARSPLLGLLLTVYSPCTMNQFKTSWIQSSRLGIAPLRMRAANWSAVQILLDSSAAVSLNFYYEKPWADDGMAHTRQSDLFVRVSFGYTS